MQNKRGVLVISLDFELYWGVRDKRSADEYRENILGVWEVVPKILDLFNKYNIHATWATVGLVFADNVAGAVKYIPDKLPSYKNGHLSPYDYLFEIKDIESNLHFAPGLIELISKQNGQEIATHTFSHYYCLEKGQSRYEFQSDIASAIRIASKFNVIPRSLVFPRNQFNKDYLNVLPKEGISSYRGNEISWLYTADNNREFKKRSKRAARLLDAYFNLTGHNTYKLSDSKDPSVPLNIPSSRFLRPVSNKLWFMEPFRLNRIKKSMKHAALNGEIFHLWFHPHNLGVNINKNLDFLRDILEYHGELRNAYDMCSLNMHEIAEQQLRKKSKVKFHERVQL
ncbi:Polysaccharide deacetylase [Modicisalibacter ilicicola DSM 19980]|uniref:Polysaccharide deacetylase n=1 Tax=Modicisalibacter ilicicola DSM 19980 TaxID=1121942 RepID=A0A1M5BZM3_9GAMM|nr:polysaccharide deacetylase family protein [Halomonas ilicicola]SHF47885.1 Polysaccharide deacetylase [Halomonas ilicicola DSM 19980]